MKDKKDVPRKPNGKPWFKVDRMRELNKNVKPVPPPDDPLDFYYLNDGYNY